MRVNEAPSKHAAEGGYEKVARVTQKDTRAKVDTSKVQQCDCFVMAIVIR